jgi:hypothetical protein
VPSGPDDNHDRSARALAPTEAAGAQTHPREDGPLATERHSVGRFRIDAELGSGGMADVYRAYDPVLDRAVALKVLHTRAVAGDTQGMRRVLREARAAAALTHPNTVTIFEVGEADGEVFIAMELLEGSVLREVLDRGKSSLEEKLRWLLQAARALEAAHERGLVHRDVKPENMFVCADGSLKLLDFGIAKRDDDEGTEAEALSIGPSSLRTQAGRRLGTPRYMAPEQHAGLATDARTDEYAWGLVAFELLCGSQVVEEQATATAEGGAEPAGASSAMRLTELRVKVPDLPEAVAAAIARALEPNKNDRFPSMAPIIRVLEARPEKKAAVAPAAAQPRGWIVTVAAGVSIVALLGFVSVRERAARKPIAIAPTPPSALPPACRTVSTRRLRIGPREHMAVMPNGGVVFALDPAEGLNLERETPVGGRAPFLRFPVPKSATLEIDRLFLRGVMIRGIPSVLLVADLVERMGEGGRSLLMVAGEDGSQAMKHVAGAPRGAAGTSFADGIAVLVATSFPNPREGLPAGAALHFPGDSSVLPVESGGAVSTPAIAATRSRLGVAYQHEGETHFVLFDRDRKRIGDVLAMSSPSMRRSGAIAFAGNSPTFFWTDTGSNKTRLRSTTFTPGDATFAASKEAIDEPLVDESPITVALPDGSFAVAWLTSRGGASTLRASPVAADGSLTGPSDIAVAATFRQLDATATPQGIDFSWVDDAGGATIAHVTCQPPTSLPDR